MPLFRNQDKIIYYAHIPKTGGSSVERALKDAGAKTALHFPKRLGYSNSTPQHMHAEIYENFVPAQFYDFAFTIVRHPIDRLLSEYKWRLKLKQTKLDFNSWANTGLKKYRDNNYLMDNHIRPQYEFIGENVKVYKFEDGLELPLREASQRLGLDNVNLKKHANKGTQTSAAISLNNLTLAVHLYVLDEI